MVAAVTNTSDLKPCPFCGAPAVVVASHLTGMGMRFYATCTNTVCRIKPTTFFTTEAIKAAEYWNNRATED